MSGPKPDALPLGDTPTIKKTGYQDYLTLNRTLILYSLRWGFNEFSFSAKHLEF